MLIGNASIDENGNISGGTPGDQTGREVWTRDWYANGWTQVCRPTDPAIAEKLASTMEAACANDNIGYSQAKRLTLNTQAKKVGYDLTQITTPCECDCSSLVAVCCIAAGLSVSPSMYTGNEVACLRNTGKFEVLTGEYLSSDKSLKRGDVLVKQYHHTAIVLGDGAYVDPIDTESVRYIDTDSLNMRTLPGMQAPAAAILLNGTRVDAVEDCGDWTKVTLTGYVATNYLSRSKPRTSYTASENLNLRTFPGLSSSVIDTIPKGTSVSVTCNTEYADGVLWREAVYKTQIGWASANYLI